MQRNNRNFGDVDVESQQRQIDIADIGDDNSQRHHLCNTNRWRAACRIVVRLLRRRINKHSQHRQWLSNNSFNKNKQLQNAKCKRTAANHRTASLSNVVCLKSTLPFTTTRYINIRNQLNKQTKFIFNHHDRVHQQYAMLIKRELLFILFLKKNK